MSKPIRNKLVSGLVREVDGKGMLEEKDKGARVGKPFTTLGYANGPGYREGNRPVLIQKQVINTDFKQEATVPLGGETHAGEDVPIFATGAGAYIVRGSMEQNWIFSVMTDATRFDTGK